MKNLSFKSFLSTKVKQTIKNKEEFTFDYDTPQKIDEKFS